MKQKKDKIIDDLRHSRLSAVETLNAVHELRYVYGMKTSEIAESTGKAAGTVANILRLRKKLHDQKKWAQFARKGSNASLLYGYTLIGEAA